MAKPHSASRPERPYRYHRRSGPQLRTGKTASRDGWRSPRTLPVHRVDRLSRALPWLKRPLSFRFVALYIALAVNALLIGAYFWSAGGATTHVRFETVNGVYTAFVDGKQQVQARCEQYDSGGVIVRTNSKSPSSALPEPRGLNRLVVTDVDSGAVLFDSGGADLQSTSTPDGWDVVSVGGSSWHNYTVDAYLKNTASGTITVHAVDEASGIVYSFRPFRHLDNGLDYIANGESTKCPVTWTAVADVLNVPPAGDTPAPGLELSRVETLKSMLAMTLRSYPYALASLCLMLALVVGLHLLGVEGRLRRVRFPSLSLWAGPLVRVVAIAAFGLLFYLSHYINQAVPHVPDELAYIFQAKVLASFHLSVPVPQPKEAFDYFYPSMLVDKGGHWASIVLFGHPLMLAIGQLFGAMWLVPPLLGAMSILLIYRIGRHIHGVQVGVIAALLLAFSPFFQMTASSMMSHNTAVFYLLACLFLITVDWKRKELAYGLAGLFFGLFINTRPLTAVALVPPFGFLFISDFVLEKEQRLAIIRGCSAFVAAVLVMVLAFCVYSLATSGSLQTGYTTNANLGSMLGFGGNDSVARGMLNDQAQLSSLLTVLNGWPLFVGLSLVLLPFMLGSRSRWDLFLLLAAVFSMGVWTAYESSGLMYGPRYWYEVVPFLMLLMARGLVLLQERLAQWTGMILRKGATGPPIAVARMLSGGLLFTLLAIAVHGWMLGKHFDTPMNDFAPRSISELRGFNGVDNRLQRVVDEMDLHHALVIVKNCPNWQCYGSVFWQNDVDFNGDVIYARDVPQMQTETAKYFDRQIYLADYNAASIVPYNPFPIRLDSPGS